MSSDEANGTLPARDGARATDEARLDALLLEVLRSRDAVADVFVESTDRLDVGASVTSSDVVRRVPVMRSDSGLALRVMTGGSTSSGHVSEIDGDLPERLARHLAATGPSAVILAHGDVRSPPVALGGLAPACGVEALEILLRDAAELLRAEPTVHRIEIDVAATHRRVHVVSSEWGHAREGRGWLVATARAFAARGRRAATARRGRGEPIGLPRAEASIRGLVLDAGRAAVARLDARPPPHGGPAVVLAPGAGGVFVHEAVGHALEADVAQRGASIFSGRIGERIAVPGLTVVDDPSLPGLPGSCAHDDEGAATRAAVLIEDGVLRATLADGLRADFRGERVTGHGRRASHREPVLPRMANTFVAAGPCSPDELVRGVASGLLVERLERAAMDPASGELRFRVTEGWRIERGRRTAPLRDFFLVGNAGAALLGIDGIGSDVTWDDGCGTCGREGQWLPVAVGQPTLRLAPGVLHVA